jgi:hypothetical protein
LHSEAAANPGVRSAGILRNRWVIGVLLALYALLFGEMFVRWLVPVPMIPRYVTAAPYGVRVGMPNMKFWQTTPETQVEIRTNSRGIRADREYSYARTPGVCRILLLGDSLFVGYEVNLEDSFAYLLDRGLVSAGIPCEVINLAVSGFGTAEMLTALREEGLKYSPDIVIFSSHVTDLDDNVRASLYALDDQGDLVRKNSRFLPGIALGDELSKYSLYRWLTENSQLYAAVRERSAKAIKAALVNMKKRQTSAVTAEASGAISATDVHAQQLHFRLLQEAKHVAEMARARFGVLEIPVRLARTEFTRNLPEYAPQDRAALHVFDPLPAFKAAADPQEKLYFERGHGHLTPRGNHVLTDYFIPRLIETGWLDPWKK